MLRSEGPEAGSWAVYYIAEEPVPAPRGNSKKPYLFSGDPKVVDMGNSFNKKELTITFRAADDSGNLLGLDKRTIGFVRSGSRVTLTSKAGRKLQPVASFDAGRDEYVTIRLSADGVFVNGTKCGPAFAVEAEKTLVFIGYNPVFDVF